MQTWKPVGRTPAGAAGDSDRAVATAFVRWTFLRAVLHRGWWLVTSLYLVVEAELSALQLVSIGAAQGLTALLFEVPTGVVADTLSRKWSVVIAHLIMGSAMLATGLVVTFPGLVLTQMAWGLAWTFSTGADVAWLTDELECPERAARVIARAARLEQAGAACGLVGFGGLAWATDLSTAIVLAGGAMILLGGYVVVRFGERGFTPRRVRPWREAASILRAGIGLVRRDPEIRVVFAATLLVNGAAEAFGRLFPKHLLDLGLPREPDPILWLSALGLVSLAAAALALRIVEARIEGAGAARRTYVVACAVGLLGGVLLAGTPDARVGMAGVVLVEGIAFSVARCVSVIWTNRRATSEVRATAQSLLAQAEYAGEIGLGLALGVLAEATSIALGMGGACGLMVAAGVVVARARPGVPRSGSPP